MLCKLKLLCNMESFITNLAMATGREVHLKSPTDPSQPSCHPILVGVGVGGAFVGAFMLPHLDLSQHLVAIRSLTLPPNHTVWLFC